MKFVKKNKFSLLIILCLIVLGAIWPEKGMKAVSISKNDAQVILSVLPPILILIGLFNVWIPKEVVIRHMGASSGIRGTALAFVLGAVAAGPLFVAFPIAAMLASKGARLANILFFIGVWTSAKLPMVLFEITFLGKVFTIIHVFVGIVMFFVGSYIIERFSPANASDHLIAMAGQKTGQK